MLEIEVQLMAIQVLVSCQVDGRSFKGYPRMQRASWLKFLALVNISLVFKKDIFLWLVLWIDQTLSLTKFLGKMLPHLRLIKDYMTQVIRTIKIQKERVALMIVLWIKLKDFSNLRVTFHLMHKIFKIQLEMVCLNDNDFDDEID